MPNEELNEIEVVLENIKHYFKLKTYAKLAEKLGVAQNTLNGWKTRQSFDAMLPKVVALCKKENLPLNTFLPTEKRPEATKSDTNNSQTFDIKRWLGTPSSYIIPALKAKTQAIAKLLADEIYSQKEAEMLDIYTHEQASTADFMPIIQLINEIQDCKEESQKEMKKLKLEVLRLSQKEKILNEYEVELFVRQLVLNIDKSAEALSL